MSCATEAMVVVAVIAIVLHQSGVYSVFEIESLSKCLLLEPIQIHIYMYEWLHSFESVCVCECVCVSICLVSVCCDKW